MKLLIVNDEQLTAETMKTGIGWAEYGIDSVHTAYDAEAAKRIIESDQIDIMLCDIEMPGENGLALLRWVRERQSEMECVFLTCHASFAYAKEAISLGCQDYILVPAKYEEIGAAILKVVNRLKQVRAESRYQEYGKYMLKEHIKSKEAGEEKEEKQSPAEIAEEICGFIMQNITDEVLNVDWLAAQFHFHPVYLNRVFKKEKQVSVGQFIINERMKMAAVMLETEPFGANEVSEKVGYSHYTNFYNMFKKYHGMSPAKYQEEYKKNIEK